MFAAARNAVKALQLGAAATAACTATYIAAASTKTVADAAHTSTAAFTREEIAAHCTAEDCWIIVGDRVYDVTSWLSQHPGRPMPILARAGKDATAEFRHFHSKEVFDEHAPQFDIGSVVGGALQEEDKANACWHEGRTEVFDYVVVGAGSAGCLLTHRLCRAGYSVALLEAGSTVSEDVNDVNDPMKYGSAFGSRLNWGHATVAQPGAGGRHIRCTRGRGVGGCSLVNGMLYNRGAREIYDYAWGREHGAEAGDHGDDADGSWPWSADLCLPYFKAHEDNSRGAGAWHGSGGEVRISDIPTPQLSPIATAFHTAAQQAGHAANADQNSLAPGMGGQLGVQIYQCFVDDRHEKGRRVTASRAFLPGRSEAFKGGGSTGLLTLRPNCTAAEIILELADGEYGATHQPQTGNGAGAGAGAGAGKVRARGVRYLTEEGTSATATARNEVILCAGVIGSAHLLLLSGIGPAASFAEHHTASTTNATTTQADTAPCAPTMTDIAHRWEWPRCVVDLPMVGSNLVDHPRVACRWESLLEGLNLNSFFSHVEGNLYARSTIAKAAAAGGGSSEIDVLETVADIQIQQDHVRTNDDMLEDPPLSTGFNLKPHAAQPRSKGNVTLASPDPRAKPRIDPAYLSDPDGRDLRCIVEGIQLAREIVAQPAFDGIRGEELQPGASIATTAQLEAWVVDNVDTGYHPVGTCRMGPTAATGVVDGHLRVHGVASLRIADASIFPHIPNGNTQAATFMVAEKAAEMILRAATGELLALERP